MKILNINVTPEEFDKIMIEQSKGKEIFAENGKIYLREKIPNQKELILKRIEEIKPRMESLSQDFIQYYLGATIENIEERKAEFISLHNEYRELLGKPPRIYK